jgi:hypothetical protein
MEKLLLNITIKRLVAIVNEGYYEELIELTKFDSNFRDTLIEVEKQLNPNKSDTYNEELLALFENFELDALIRAYTVLDGAIDKFTFGNETPIPSLLDRLSELDYQKLSELTEWVVKNKANDYQVRFTFHQSKAKPLVN